MPGLIDRLRRSPLVRGIVIVGALTLAARGMAVVRELVVAGTYGVGEDLDAVFAALVIPIFLIGILTSTVQSLLIPELVAARSQGGDQMFGALIASATSWVTLLGAALAGVLLLLSAPIMAAMTTGLGQEARVLAVDAFRLAIPILLVGGVLAVWTSALQAIEVLGVTSFALVLIPATPAAVVAALGAETGPIALVWGVMLGHFLALAPAGWGLASRGISPRLSRPVIEGRLGSALRQSSPVASGYLMHSSAPVVDVGMAGFLGGGSVAALQFGVRVVDGTVSVLASAIGVTIFPRLARVEEGGDRAGMIRMARRWLVVALVIGIPVAATIALLSEDIVRLLFLRGEFSPADVSLVSSVQAMYALQIPFYLAGFVLVRVVHVVRRNSLLLVAATISLALNISLNYLLMRLIGLPGIALSTSIVYLVFVIVLVMGVSRFREDAAAPDTS